MPQRRAFTLVELLVVLGIIGLLIGILIPALNAARRSADKARCLSNIRNMQVAHWMYVIDNKGWMINANLAHGGGGSHGPTPPWVESLSKYFGQNLLHRCPSDRSVHWPEEGVPVPPTTDTFRRSSYGINNFLDAELCPWGPDFAPLPPAQPYVKIEQVGRPSAVVHFLEMAEDGEFAGADHPHVEHWVAAGQPDSPPILAGRQVQTHRHGGKRRAWDAVANYGFLDGHAETLRFREVFESFQKNRFDPAIAR